MEETKRPGRLQMALAGLALFFVWFVALVPWIPYQFWQSDTWWLIETGRLIIEKHALPLHDPYSFTTLPAQWTAYQWLTEVFFGLANGLGGLSGVALFGGMLFSVLLFGLIFRHVIRTGSNPLVAVFAIILCAYSYYPDFSSLRPQIISFVLFWLMVALCARVKTGMTQLVGKARWIAMAQTFVIAVIWANCHISFPVAILLLVANLFGALWCLLRKQCDQQRPILFAALLVTFIAGTLVTPFGGSLWQFIGNTHNLFYSQEVQPLKWGEQPFLSFMALLSWTSLIYQRKKFDAGDLLSMLALGSIGNNCTRLIVYFCIFSIPVIATAGTQLLEAPLTKGMLARFSLALKTLALSRVYIAILVLWTTLVVVSQPRLIPGNIPIRAAQYLKEHPVQGNLFCSAHAGSYLIYSSRGAIPVFADTRVDLYHPEFCKQFISTMVDGTNWQEQFKKYKIKAALLPNGVKLRRILDKEPNWKRVHEDKFFSVYVTGASEPPK